MDQELRLGYSGLARVASGLFLGLLLAGIIFAILQREWVLAALLGALTPIIVVALRESLEEWAIDSETFRATRAGRVFLQAPFEEIVEVKLDTSRRRVVVTTSSGQSTRMPARLAGLWDFVSELISEVRKRRDLDIVGPIELTDVDTGEALR